jgi:hypothetical protein
MKPLSETYKEQGIAFTFPIEIKDGHGNETYFESSKGYCYKRECDANDNETYYENSEGYWYKREYDAKGNKTYYEDSGGFWYKREYDANGNVTYTEDSDGYKSGTSRSAKTCEGKVIEVDGIKYKLTAQ